MGSCEVCGDPTSEDRSDAPADEQYFTAVFVDGEAPEGAIPKTEFQFCSVEHLRIFVPEGQRGN
jgi:hypothetical protein